MADSAASGKPLFAGELGETGRGRGGRKVREATKGQSQENQLGILKIEGNRGWGEARSMEQPGLNTNRNHSQVLLITSPSTRPRLDMLGLVPCFWLEAEKLPHLLRPFCCQHLVTGLLLNWIFRFLGSWIWPCTIDNPSYSAS